MNEVFTDQQVEKLEAKLDGTSVATRKQSGLELSYLEGYYVINQANRIFGFGNWEGQVVRLEHVIRESFDKGGKEGFRVTTECEYEVTVRSHPDDGKAPAVVRRRDVGHGHGISYGNPGDAFESASKEAATDAMKRAFRTFGNQFGNALYDKEQKQVDYGPDLEMISSVYSLLPPEKKEDAKETVTSILSRHGAAKLSQASSTAMKEVYDFLTGLKDSHQAA